LTDRRLIAPAAARNREPIVEILHQILPPRGTVLEVASGSGEHVVFFAQEFPELWFQPSDPDHGALSSIQAWVAAEGVCNVADPVVLDATADHWPVDIADAVICINMIHISPWAASQGLFAHAGAMLPENGVLYLYGPFRRQGAPWADSNEAFDRSLQQRDSQWGIRNLDSIIDLAKSCGFGTPEIFEMPANNLSVVFTKLAPMPPLSAI
jgi:SAM-dependent methyltransferase